MSDLVHLIAVDEGARYGWSATSPQLPGFVFGRPNLDDFKADLPSALKFEGVDPSAVLIHNQRRIVSPEAREYLVRVAEDGAYPERIRTAEVLLAALQSEQRQAMLDQPTTPTGEVAFICARAGDRLGWIAEQLDERNDVIVIACLVAGGELIWTGKLATGAIGLQDDTKTLPQLGLTLDSTVADQMRILASPSRTAVLV